MVLAQEFYLDDFYWNVKAFYVVDSIPIDYILDELSRIGCSEADLDQAELLLNNNSKDKGLTYSNLEERESVIVIGETSSPEEFQHTFDHEKIHLAMHIGKYFKINPYSEELAYLVGDIGSAMFPIAKKFLCEHCREELR
jgi:hypothetical protein